MKKTIAAALAGFMAGIALCGGVAAAETLARTADSAVTVDGHGVALEAYNIDDANYFKLRDLAAALDVAVWYDSVANTIRIETEKKYDPDYGGPMLEPSPYSADDPAPAGVVQWITAEGYPEAFTVGISVDEVARGDMAWEILREVSPYNNQPGEDTEYILVCVTAQVYDTGANPAPFSMISFDVFSGEVVLYEGLVYAVAPEPRFYGDIGAGGRLSGYIAFMIDKNDPAPVAAYGRRADGSGGIWFSLADTSDAVEGETEDAVQSE